MSDHRRVLMTDAQLCERMSVTSRTTLRWRSEGTGPRFIRVGGAIRYDEADVDAWLASRTFEHRAAEATGRCAA